MSNRLLKKALLRKTLPLRDLERLIWNQIADADMLSAILDNGNEGHLVLSEKEKIRYANTSFFTLLPSNRSLLGKAEGKKLSDIIRDDEVLSYLKEVARKKGEEEKEFYFQQGAQVRSVRITQKALVTEEGEYLDIIVRDVTEDKRRETRLRRSESLASMTTMAAGIAHEIKNPLAAMQIHLQLLKKAYAKKGSLTAAEASRYTDVLEEEITRLNGIVVDFLFAVRPMDVNLKLESLLPMLESLTEFVRPELTEHNIKLKLDIQSFLPKLEIDSNYLKQALLNIVKNAMNAMECGGELTISCKAEGNFVFIKVQDTGCGIPSDQMAKIFEPYFTTKASGTGLGLTVVYKVVKEHKGEITVDSEVGKGTVFTIRLPIPSSERILIEEKGEK